MADKVDEPDVGEDDLEVEEVQPEGTIVCALTGSQKKDTSDEQTLQSMIEQLHREYDVALEDMQRDFRVTLEIEDPRTGKIKTQRRPASLVVFETGAAHTQENIIRVAVVAKSATKPTAKKGIPDLTEIIGSLNDRPQVFGLWTNGADLAFRMRTFHKRTGVPEFTELTDFPAPNELLEDLESAERKPLPHRLGRLTVAHLPARDGCRPSPGRRIAVPRPAA